jgi:hypothetical protein
LVHDCCIAQLLQPDMTADAVQVRGCCVLSASFALVLLCQADSASAVACIAATAAFHDNRCCAGEQSLLTSLLAACETLKAAGLLPLLVLLLGLPDA